MHSKYDNMHKNEMVYVLVCISNHIITCINCMFTSNMIILKIFNYIYNW